MYSLKIDAYAHIMPPKYKDAFWEAGGENFFHRVNVDRAITLWNMDRRREVMDKYEGLLQILTTATPPVQQVVSDPKKAADLARLANDEMAELVYKYPDYFIAAVACLPLNDIDASLKEIDRAIKELRFRGIQLQTPLNDKPLDSPEFLPIFEKMSEYDLPILVHPSRTPEYPDYKNEDKSKYRIYANIGWPYDTACMMLRLTFSGIMQKYPGLKILTHHAGGFLPYVEERTVSGYDNSERRGDKYKQGLNKPPIVYLKRFYLDTALYGSPPALMCAYAFGGADHMVFATDFPYDNQLGSRYIRQTINAVEAMDISDSEKKMIFEDNARKLFQLPV